MADSLLYNWISNHTDKKNVLDIIKTLQGNIEEKRRTEAKSEQSDNSDWLLLQQRFKPKRRK